ncbi:tail fiber assembly protein [Yersinia pestis]|uniref:tail fiber assembly protein n=1 Tax=Yersinia pestis TaxID=632 RepID=UPI00187B28DB|nr:tail fiber assembly protein [Yersinia pestis]MBE7861587.1 tail fiber assembly protein [Yersinia pestis]
MSYFYSKATGGFYLVSMKNEYEEWPADVVLVSDSDYEQLFSGQDKGEIITADANGYPILSDQPEPTHDELIAEAEAKRSELMLEATQTIATLQDALDLEMATDDEKSQLVEWKKYRVLVSRIDTADAPGISWPEYPG